MSQQALNQEPLLSWTFDERDLHQRTAGLYVGATLFAVALLVYAFFSANFLFGVLVVLSVLVFVVLHRDRQVVHFSVTPEGISINGTLYPMDTFRHFFIVYQPPQIKKLYFDLKGFRNRIIIPLLDHDPVAVREKLLPLLFEDREREHEPVSDMLSRILKL